MRAWPHLRPRVDELGYIARVTITAVRADRPSFLGPPLLVLLVPASPHARTQGEQLSKLQVFHARPGPSAQRSAIRGTRYHRRHWDVDVHCMGPPGGSA